MYNLLNKKSSGFSLIELLVVIAIIGILAGIITASLNSARGKGRDAKRVADLGQVHLVLKLYYEAEGKYPDGAGGLDVLSDGAVFDELMPNLPVDPRNTGNFQYYYDSDVNCTASGQRALYVVEVENNKHKNFSDVCSGTGSDFVGETPTNGHIILLQ